MRRAGILLSLLLGFLASLSAKDPPPPKPDTPSTPAPAPAPAPAVSPDEQHLKNSQLDTTAPALLEFFRKRSQPGVDRAVLQKLVEQLRDPNAETANRAAGELVGWGPASVPLLRQTANNLEHAESAGRARRCLQYLEGPEAAALTTAAARLLAGHKAAGTVEALLHFLPFAEDERVVDDLRDVLLGLAGRDGEPDPALPRALTDPLPLRRAVAGEVLLLAGGAEHKAAARRLLQDPKPTVRLRVALALANVHDAEAVTVLIGLLGELPLGQVKHAEEFLQLLAGDWAVQLPAGGDAVARRLRRDLWASWWQALDGTALLDEVRKRTLADADRDRVRALIKQTGDDDPARRDQAFAQLQGFGAAALALVRRLENDPDPSTSARAKPLRELLERDAPPPLSLTAARLLALRKPAGAAAALLAYLPYADDESLAAEVQTALNALAVRDGQPDPALVGALADPLPLRRAAAAEALGQAATADTLRPVRKLLQDADATVRLRTALTLATRARDKDAVPVLIALVAELPADRAGEAEDYLRQAAGDKAPAPPQSGDEAARKQYQQAWAAWWREHGPAVQLPRADAHDRLLGFTLIVEQYSNLRRSGRIFEVDAAGRLRWDMPNLSTPMDAQVLAGNRVLVAEYGAGRVTERDFKGNILWQKAFNQPMNVKRLPNGNTFIAGRMQLAEVDRGGKEVFVYNRPNGDIMAGAHFANGHMALVAYDGSYVRVDRAGKEVKSFRIDDIPNWGGNPEILPNDRILLALYNTSKVVEYSEGKEVWTANVQNPQSATRLRNGHTLVAVAQGTRVVELDRAGKQVWEYKENLRAWRLKRR